MKGKYIFAGVMALTAVTSAYADPPKGFEEFRKGIMDNFNSFRSRVLDHYADFLAGEWHEYEALEATEKYSAPKPAQMPVMEMEVEEIEPQKKELMISLGFADVDLKELQPKPDPDFLKWIRDARELYTANPNVTEISFAQEDLGKQPGEGDIVTPDGFLADYGGDIFNFYGMQFALPKTDFKILPKIDDLDDFAKQWTYLDSQKFADRLIPEVRKIQQLTGISDYLLFEMLMAYADSRFPEANDAAKMAFTHYLLCQMEYSVRIAIDTNGQPFMLIPFEEPIYGRSAMNLDKQYYVFSTPGRPFRQRAGLRTPYIPEADGLGKSLSLRMNGLNLPMNPFHYSFEYDGLTLEGDMNQNIIPILYKYPQMDTSGFAASVISQDVRDDVVRQLKEQLGGLEPIMAADKLLAMIQFGFPYATDDNYHGFEKPYFFEEILFYPKSDCEDRSIFYSYLLHNALGLEADLIAYPNHEATAIRAEQVWGGDDHYVRHADKFFISDPTYSGAPTGSSMPRYKGVTPKVDLSYSNSEWP